MELRISPYELEQLLRNANMISEEYVIQGISRATGLIPTIKVYLVKKTQATSKKKKV